jgi:hypothetical protein
MLASWLSAIEARTAEFAGGPGTHLLDDAVGRRHLGEIGRLLRKHGGRRQGNQKTENGDNSGRPAPSGEQTHSALLRQPERTGFDEEVYTVLPIGTIGGLSGG